MSLGPGRRRRVYSNPAFSTRRRKTAAKAADSADSAVGRSGSKYIHAQADPFSEQVEGVKIPDANSQPSVAIKAEDAFTISTGAAQTSIAWAFNPSTTKMAVTGVYASATTWTWAALYGGSTASSKNSKLISDMELWRPVAHAIRITSGMAPTTTTGFVHVAVFSQALYNQSTWTYPTSIADLANVPGYKRIPIARLTAEGLVVVNRPLDCTSQRYVDTDDGGYAQGQTGEFSVPYQWGCIVVAVEAAPVASTVLSVESILHMECIPRASSISTPTPAASYSPAALGGASNAMSKTTTTFLDSASQARQAVSLENAKRGIQKTVGGKTSRALSSFNLGGGKYSDRRPSIGGTWSANSKTIGIPGVNDRKLPGAGKSNVDDM